MSDAIHVPGPLRQHGVYPHEAVRLDSEDLIASAYHTHELDDQGRLINDAEANICRVIACWNACVDIPDPGKTIPQLLAACRAMDSTDRGGQIPWVHNAADTNDIEALRAICIAQADVWNSMMLPAIAAAEGGGKS